MLFNWKGIAIVLAVIAAVIGLCAVDLRCSGKPSDDSQISRMKGELTVLKNETRNRQADDLARLALDLRVLAKRYVADGDKKKAQRAIAAAQELDRKIEELRNCRNEGGR